LRFVGKVFSLTSSLLKKRLMLLRRQLIRGEISLGEFTEFVSNKKEK
jgi:hypothetical protein